MHGLLVRQAHRTIACACGADSEVQGSSKPQEGCSENEPSHTRAGGPVTRHAQRRAAERGFELFVRIAFEFSRFRRLLICSIDAIDEMQSACHEQEMQPDGFHPLTFRVLVMAVLAVGSLSERPAKVPCGRGGTAEHSASGKHGRRP